MLTRELQHKVRDETTFRVAGLVRRARLAHCLLRNNQFAFVCSFTGPAPAVGAAE